MFYCEECNDTNACERTDLANEPVLCDECYRKAKRDEAITRFKAEVRNVLCKKR